MGFSMETGSNKLNCGITSLMDPGSQNLPRNLVHSIVIILAFHMMVPDVCVGMLGT